MVQLPRDTIADVEADLEARQQEELLLSELYLLRDDRSRTRNEQRSPQLAPATPGVGRAWMSTSHPTSRGIYETLLWLEPSFPPELEHSLLISPLCQILERELDRRIAQPARALGTELVKAWDAEPRTAEVVEKWVAGVYPTTLTIESIVLDALARAHREPLPQLRRFIDKRFKAPYQRTLAAGELATTIDILAKQFRNPAAHGRRRYDGTAYAHCVRLVLGHRSVIAFDEEGSVTEAPSEGVLSLHLRCDTVQE
jgi:hypothetical protein